MEETQNRAQKEGQTQEEWRRIVVGGHTNTENDSSNNKSPMWKYQ
jgi:hypothetical protein